MEFWPSIVTVHVLVLISISILPADCFNKLGNETDRLALLELKAQIEIGDDPYGIFSSWNDSVSFCKWQGVACGRKHKRVTSLNLQGLSLQGTISPYIKNLTFLSYLNLANNKFHGEIPQEVGYLFRLRVLNLTNNTFEGEIPANISYCSVIRIIDLDVNSLSGKIPAQLGSLKKLVALYLGENYLTGKIPHSFGNLSSLRDFSFRYNNLGGNIPNELGRLKSLSFFNIAVNNLTGTIPPTFYNISSITRFYASTNKLNGSLPENIGVHLPNLRRIGLGANQFHGSIPASLTNASQLQLFDISDNFFTGRIPNNLGDLQGLERINFESNFLGNNTSQDLSFISSLSNCSNLIELYFDRNNFGGLLPSFIGNLSTLQQLGIGTNQISGRIPEELGNLISLYILGLEKNFFSGTIPFSIGKLQNLQMFYLGANELSGEIPPSLGNISQLYDLDLSVNKLQGNLTSSIANCRNLDFFDVSDNNLTGLIPQQIIGLSSLSTGLDLSHNSFTGPIPLEIGKLKNINALDVSDNKLYGKIPEAIGDCLMLEKLNMQGNFFQGHIPSSFASLRGLQLLDLSRNNLSGNISKELEKLPFLQYLNLSFNDLEGEVPKEGVFSNSSAFSLVGNTKLCGGIPELQLPACLVKQKKHKSLIVIILTTTCSIVIFMIVMSLCIFYRSKSTMNPSFTPSIADRLPQFSYKDLLQATGGFSLENLIGQGSFGSVYKGSYHSEEEKIVAIKVLNLQQHGASKSFIAECNALRNIRHRNLVKLLTYCSSIDFKGNDFKALVFDFMENGSLDTWLHQQENGNSHAKNLNFRQRLHIAIDVSSALHYLHDNCETPVIHCDLKSSNILLDNDMTAHIGDFGLARLLSKTTNNYSQGQTSSIGIKGTIGYMAPEYATGNEATTAGDVYSFGIILLEIFTGKSPIDEVFTDGLNLHNFVKAKHPGQVMQVVDPKLIITGDFGSAENMGDHHNPIEIQEQHINLRLEGGINVQKCIVSILEIGLACSSEQPRDRMNMRDVTRKLNLMMDAFLHGRTV